MSLLSEEVVKSCTLLYEDTIAYAVNAPPSIKLDKFEHFNKLTGGFRPNEFTILCGATGVGKTTLLSNWSAQLLRQNVKHYVASIETGHKDYILRVLSVLAGKDINTGEPVDKEVMRDITKKFGHYFADFGMYLSLYDNRFKVEQLIENIEFAVKEKGCKIAFVDNLNFFLEITSAQNSIVEMDRVVHELIMFCKRTDVHIVMVMHPKKTESGRVLSEFDIKGSSTAVQEAQNVFLFNRISDNALSEIYSAQHNDRELKIAKMRRLGKYVGHTIVYGCDNTAYNERGYMCLKR